MNETLSEQPTASSSDPVLEPIGPDGEFSPPAAERENEGQPTDSLQNPAVDIEHPTEDVETSFDPTTPRPFTDMQTPLPEEQNTEDVLHVGCGTDHPEKLPVMFRKTGWREIRLDVDPEVHPDFVASITDMHVISDDAVGAVYSSHNIEHLYPHEVPLALREMRRVLKPDGFVFIKLPDLQEVARHVAEGKLEDPLYISPMGPISPLDIMYGHRPSLASGNAFMAHRTGFTGETLGAALVGAGFAAVMVQRDPAAFCLTAVAFRSKPNQEQIITAQTWALSLPDQPAVLYTPMD